MKFYTSINILSLIHVYAQQCRGGSGMAEETGVPRENYPSSTVRQDTDHKQNFTSLE